MHLKDSEQESKTVPLLMETALRACRV